MMINATERLNVTKSEKKHVKIICIYIDFLKKSFKNLKIISQKIFTDLDLKWLFSINYLHN